MDRDQTTTPRTSRRLIVGAAVVVFLGAFFVAPLCLALSLCTMPCCAHAEAGLAAPGMTGCGPQVCVTSSDEATETAVTTVAPQRAMSSLVVTPIVFASVATPPAAALEHPPGESARASAAPLHLLNSTFRI